MRKSFYFIFAMFCLQACAPRFDKYFAAEKDVINTAGKADKKICSQTINYAPDASAPIKYIRVNFHIMLPKNGEGNFNEQQGRQYVKELIAACNAKLMQNQKMNLPKDNNTPVLPTQIRYVLWGDKKTGSDGIYFNYDDSTCYFAKNTRGRFSETDQLPFKYAVGSDSIINFYLIEHHPDSLKNNPKYNVTAAGITYTRNIKIFGAYYNNYTTFYTNEGNAFNKGPAFYAGLINHEVAHFLGLSHTWQFDDGCDDTPKNADCWGPTGMPPCESPTSNNTMDYNAYQDAFTPCQLGKMHYNMWKENSEQRKVLINNWCTYNADKKTIIARDAIVEWKGGKDLLGDIEIREGATLIIYCTVSLPQGAKIIVKPGAKLILNGGIITNRCGNEWDGIEIWKSKKLDMAGEVQITNGGKLENIKNFAAELK